MRSIRKSIAAESDDDATRSSSGGGSSAAATAQRQVDLSLLRKPIVTAVTGFLEALRAYEAGTEEIRKLLASECDLLYECRVCRNLFRSLTNFISHKRVYCRKLFNVAQHFHFQNDGFLDLDIATIVHAEQDSQSKAKKSHVDVLNKDLSSIVERLRRKQHKLSTEQNMTDYYDKVNHKITQDDLNRQQHVLQLDRVPSSKAAVFQTVRLGVVDSMRVQVDELEHLNNNNTVLSSDGKAVQIQSRPQSTLPVIRGPSEQYFRPIELETEQKVQEEKPVDYRCQECNLQFGTEMMLKLHTDIRHTPSAYVYTCPSCSQTFTQPRAVIRHLSRDHKKSMRRIKLLRDSILKRRVRADEVVAKGPSRELARLAQGSANAASTNGSSQNGTSADGDMPDHDEAAATRAWMENLEHFDQGPMCSYCGKTFDRKAVLSTHMQTCVHKLRQTENGSVPPSSSASSSSSSRTRGKAKEEPPPASVETPEIKQEPIDPAASDDSNSYDVPLSTLQSRLQQEVKQNVLTIKPEELAIQEDAETSSRRKRKKPMIMLRNAIDDISWETDEEVDRSTTVVETEEIVVSVVQQVKQEATENGDTEPVKLKKRIRKKKVDEKEEIFEKESLEKLESGEEIVCRCSKKFNDPEQYKRHLKVYHSRQKRFWCAVCEFKGYRKVDTINHLMQEHGYQGDVEDISSLINVQVVEKAKKTTSENTPNAREQINSIIEAVSRSCDTIRTDISFVESPVGNTTEPPQLDTSRPVRTASGTFEESATTSVPSPESKKRRRPIRASRNSICMMPPEVPDFIRKPKPSQTSSTEDSASTATSKRPIRNRVKPVDKDFVYDLTHLLNKDEDLDDFPLPELVLDKPSSSSSPAKPKPPESSRPSSSVNSVSPSKRESLRSHAPKPIPAHLVKGAAYQMAKRQVELGLAAFHRPPEIPQERTFMHTQLTPPRRMITTIHDWPVIKKERKIGSITKQVSDIQIHRRYQKRASSITTSLPDLLRDKRHSIPRRNSVVPLRQKLSASIKILNKLNASRSAAGLAVVQLADGPPLMVKCPTEEEFRELVEANLKDHRATLSQANPNGTQVDELSDPIFASPKKRITLMERLQENRNRRMQEQNGGTSLTMERPPPPAPSTSSFQSTAIAGPSSSSSCSSSKSVPNVAEMLHAKLKRYSSC